MGSEQFQRYPGLKRRAEGAGGDPYLFTVIGVDIAPAALITKYKGSKQAGYASDVIGAVVQKYRTAKPPPASFVDLCRGGIHEPIIVCDLGADAKGKSWMVVVDGRQRNLSARAINDERSGVSVEVTAVFRPFKRESAGIDAMVVKVVANARVPRTYSQRAEDAGDLRARNIAISPPMVDARDDAEVELLVLLNGCAEGVKTAVDAGSFLLADVAALAKCDHEEQERRVTRKTAGKGKAAKDGAAPARAKTRPAPVLASVEAMARRMTSDMPADADPGSPGARIRDAADIARWAQGGEPPSWWVKVVMASEAERMAVRKKGAAK